jgi:hypothetical protein
MRLRFLCFAAQTGLVASSTTLKSNVDEALVECQSLILGPAVLPIAQTPQRLNWLNLIFSHDTLLA